MLRKLNFQTVPLAEISPESAAALRSDRPVVLVVDDEQIIAETLAVILNQSGYAALTAHSGPSALKTASVIPPQMLITDVCMPGMSGIELGIAIRETVPDCKVLLFSGQASTAELLATARTAGYDFEALSKPIHPTELLARVSKCLTGPESDTPASWSFLQRARGEARSA
jgi:DNA-binding response OmpR family regulator